MRKSRDLSHARVLLPVPQFLVEQIDVLLLNHTLQIMGHSLFSSVPVLLSCRMWINLRRTLYLRLHKDSAEPVLRFM